MEKVAVVGAAGATGHLIVEQLQVVGVEVVALVRRAGSAPVASGVTEVMLDLGQVDVARLTELLRGCDAVVFAAAGDPQRVDHHGAVAMMDAAKHAGVPRFVLLSGLGAGRERPASLRGGFWDIYFGAKETSEAALRSSGLAWTIVQPAELTNDAGTGRVRLGSTGELPIDQIARADVARVIIGALQDERSIGHSFEAIRGEWPVAEAIERAVTTA